MGSTSTSGGSGNGKGSTSNSGTSMPAWANVGSKSYNNMNTMLQTAPMNVANQTFANNGQGAATQSAIKQLQGMGGANPWMTSAADSLKQIGQVQPGTITNPGSVNTSYYKNIYNEAQAPGAANDYLTSYARGDFLGGSPQLQDIIRQTNQDTADQVNSLASGMGRYGSGAQQGVLADSIAKNTSNLLYNDYNQQQQNQLAAINALEGAQQGRMGIGLNAASGLAGVQGQNIANNLSVQGQNTANSMNAQQQNIANRLGAAGQLGQFGQAVQGNQVQNLLGAAGLENQGIGNVLSMIGALPTIQNNKVFDANQQMGVGNKLDTASQNQLNDLINQWNQTDMQDWARLGGLLTTGTTSAGGWGTQTQTSKQPANILGALGALFGAL